MSLVTVEQFLFGVYRDSTRKEPLVPPIELFQSDDPSHVIVLSQNCPTADDYRLDPWFGGATQEVSVSGLLVLTFDQAVTLWVGQVGSSGGDEGPGASYAIDIPAPPADGKSFFAAHVTFTRSATRGVYIRTGAETEVNGWMVIP